MFFLISDDLMKVPENERGKVLDSFVEQIKDFWEREVTAYNSGLVEIAKSKKIKCPTCNWQGPSANLKTLKDNSMVCPNCGEKELIF